MPLIQTNLILSCPVTIIIIIKGGVKVKVKVTLEEATKAQRGSICTDVFSLTSALERVGGQHHTPASL